MIIGAIIGLFLGLIFILFCVHINTTNVERFNENPLNRALGRRAKHTLNVPLCIMYALAFTLAGAIVGWLVS